MREKRTTILAWFFAGALAMYFEAIAIAAELRDYPGGPVELAKSIMPTIEGMRIIRWPADRLDTLGGYLCYHNVVLFNYFLALFAAVQGARLIRHMEESGQINFILSAKVTRRKLVSLRALSYFISQLIISLGLGVATAFALAVSNEPNTSGAIITLLAGGICIFPFFGAGVLISQFVTSSRTATGLTAILVTLIYILGNISDKYSWLNWVQYISPFHYADLSRPIIPGFTSNYWSWLAMVILGLVLIAISASLFNFRDVGSVAIQNAPQRNNRKIGFVPRTLVGDILWRQRYGLLAWVITSTAFTALFIGMMSGIIDIWEKFSFLQQFTSGGFGQTASQQYLAMVYEVLPPFIAGFIIMQSSKWTLDLTQGRVPLFLATPISLKRLLIARAGATLIGGEMLIIFTIATVIIGSNWQNVGNYPNSILRVFVMSNLFIFSFTSICLLIIALLHGKSATQVLSIYLGAAWLIIFMAPYLNWPRWIMRLSIFDAFGHPFVKWPGTVNFTFIAVSILIGAVGSVLISNRSSKSY